MKGKFGFFAFVGFAAILAMLAGSAFLFLGPDLHFGRKERLLAKCQFADNSKIFLVQTPNRTIVEPYTINLYHLYPDGKAEACQIGFEESYWWGAALKPRGKSHVDITYLGFRECTYDVSAKRLLWTDKSYPPLRFRVVDYSAASNKLVSLGAGKPLDHW